MSSVSRLTCVATFCVIFHMVALCTDAKAEEPLWSKKSSFDSSYAAVRGQRSPSTSRFKSGPAPGSWYYIMGHGHDSKRTASDFDELGNEIPRIVSSASLSGDLRRPLVVSPSTRVSSRMTSPLLYDHRQQLSTNRKMMSASGKAVAGSDASSVLLLPPSRTSDASADEARPKEVDTSGQKILNEFLYFLSLKERNLLSHCIPSKDDKKN